MDREHAAGGGWEAAIDASLAARLLRPAVRAGISDPAHGAKLAARLQRATAPSLADDVARRYGSATLEGGRPPIVYAAPAAPAPGDASTADPASGTGGVEAGPARGVSLRASDVAARPVVRAAERAAPPAFPPLRPLGAGPVQRVLDPGAAPLVVVSRRTAAESREGTAGLSTDRASTTIPISAPPVVKPAPTRLQRQLAAEHAQAAAPIASTLPLVHAAGSRPHRHDGSTLFADSGARSGAGEAASPATPPVVQRAAAADGAAGTASPAMPPLSSATAGDGAGEATPVRPFVIERTAASSPSGTAGVVQRATGPDGAAARVEGRTAGEGSVAASSAVLASTARPPGQGDVAGSTPPAALPFASPATLTREAGAPTADAAPVVRGRAAEAAAGAGPAGIIQRSVDPAGPVARVEGRPAGEGSVAASPVVPTFLDRRPSGESRAADSFPHAAPAAGVRAAEASVAPRTFGVAGRSPAGRPVVAPRAGSGAAPVQRSLLGLAGMAVGGAARLAYAAASAANPASGREGRAAATATPPPGAPPAELPTVTTPGAEPVGTGAGTARVAEEVYQLLVRRLETERKQRGW